MAKLGANHGNCFNKKGGKSSIPALRDANGDWVLEGRGKANLFVKTFSAKFVLAEAKHNEYTTLSERRYKQQEHYPLVTEE